jgi:hypothetical protein
MALFWNFEEIGADSRTIVEGVYRELAPELLQEAANKPGDRADDLRGTAAFGPITTHTFAWDRTLRAGDWVGKVGTQSDHLLLGPRRLAEVQARLRTALDGAGGHVHLTGGTYIIWARPRS